MEGTRSNTTEAVLSRAETAIRRARGLTLAYSSLLDPAAPEQQDDAGMGDIGSVYLTSAMASACRPPSVSIHTTDQAEAEDRNLTGGTSDDKDLAEQPAKPLAADSDGQRQLATISISEDPSGREHQPVNLDICQADGSSTSFIHGHSESSPTALTQPAASASASCDLAACDGDADYTTSSLRRATEPVLAVAQRLASLQRQQAETMRQLLRLRLEQLRLRQQQLSALQCLLRTEAACIEGNPLQLSAVQQAVELLADSLDDVHRVGSALQWDGEVAHVAAVAQNVSEADARAEEVSIMARQLLAAMRRHPMRNLDAYEPDPQLDDTILRGATKEEMSKHPVVSCTSDHACFGDLCAICLGIFTDGDEMRALQCSPPESMHYFHRACIDEWLGIKACCPLCKHEIIG